MFENLRLKTLRCSYCRSVFLFCLLTLLSGYPIRATAETSDAESIWRLRSEGFLETGHANTKYARQALAEFEAAYAKQPSDTMLGCRVLEARYFVGEFVASTASERKKLYESSAILSEQMLQDIRKSIISEAHFLGQPKSWQKRALSTHPNASLVYFWAAIHQGLWGMSHSYMASARAGVVDKIRSYAKMLIAIDPQFADGAGYRLLGRLHTQAPKIPFFSFWINDHYGLSLLRKAYAISRDDPRNALFLAQAILAIEPEKVAEAKKLLQEVARFSIADELLVEQSAIVAEATKELSRIP